MQTDFLILFSFLFQLSSKHHLKNLLNQVFWSYDNKIYFVTFSWKQFLNMKKWEEGCHWYLSLPYFPNVLVTGIYNSCIFKTFWSLVSITPVFSKRFWSLVPITFVFSKRFGQFVKSMSIHFPFGVLKHALDLIMLTKSFFTIKVFMIGLL